MTGLTAAQLADQLSVSRARVSQWVSEGKLDGCYIGDGRARRFDPDSVATRLNRTLSPGQMLGNGAKTKTALRQMDATPAAPPSREPSNVLDANDLDRYELAKIQSAEEDARRKRRDNQRDEGQWVLAAEVQRQTARAIAQEVARFELVIRDGSRAVADKFGMDYRAVRAAMMEIWRTHRASRVAALTDQAESARLTETESSEQV